MDGDKYPPESGRRQFVKGVVGASVLGSIGVSGSGLADVATEQSGTGGGSVVAKVIERTDGPADRGMSQIPIEIEDGYLKGVWPDETDGDAAVTTIAGTRYSSKWFQYCGVQTHPNLAPDSEADNFLRSDSAKGYDWQSGLEEGARLRVADFEDYEEWHNGVGDSGLGKPAAATWRSQETTETIPVQVLRSPRIEELAAEDDWLAATTDEGFLAWLNKCTHLCCVPAGFKQSTQVDGAENAVYCQCHQSVYDPFSVVESVFTAFPRPDGGEEE